MTDTSELREVEVVAHRFFDALALGKLALVEQCLCEDFTAWHNFDDIKQTRGEHLKTLAWLCRSIHELRFEDVHRSVYGGGFSQRHVLRGQLHGQPFQLFACIVGEVEGGLIKRTFEYVDSAQLAPMFQRRTKQEQTS
ncbi:nuclear transport factor 2 family protein [Peristeroidobacter soli]|uniref:nuclear transport factor 2 family protein n=1 Tax=Peristeroidobacter soli TaxID=2497877 RepID=UPI00101CF49A|nr:ketosteroid isomerase [Peristeroidobacter soli]